MHADQFAVGNFLCVKECIQGHFYLNISTIRNDNIQGRISEPYKIASLA